jgi:hypothetical protein
MARVRLSTCPSESLRTTTVRRSSPFMPRLASQSMVWPAVAAPSTHGEDTTIRASRSRSTSCVTGESIVELQSTIEIVK